MSRIWSVVTNRNPDVAAVQCVCELVRAHMRRYGVSERETMRLLFGDEREGEEVTG